MQKTSLIIGIIVLFSHLIYFRISVGRRLIEQAFGLWRARFRMLDKPIKMNLTHLKPIIKSTQILHNFAIDTQEVEDGRLCTKTN